MAAEESNNARQALTQVNRLADLPNTHENRQLMREALKQCISVSTLS